MGKKMHYRSQEIQIQGQACCLETWHTSRNWVSNNRHSKCTHYATGNSWTGFSKDGYAEAETQARNQANISIATWLQQQSDEEARKLAAELKKQKELQQKAEAESKRIAQQLRKQKEAKAKAEAETRRIAEQLRKQKEAKAKAEAEARRVAQQLKLQKKEQKAQLISNRNGLNARLQEKQQLLNVKRSDLTNLSRQIATEEKAIAEFSVERNDDSTKIIVTLGMTGAGKSTLCNRLYGDTSLFGNETGPCQTAGNSQSCTQKNGKVVTQIGNQRITVVDTPGYGDTFGRDRQHCNKLCAYLKGCGGINAFVLVRNGTNPKFDQSFQAMLTQYHNMFGGMFFQRLIIVASRIDSRINRLQFGQNNQAIGLRNDICDKFKCNEGCDIPVISIGFEGYNESIGNLVRVIPSDKFIPQNIKSPIDGLKAKHSAIQSEENRLMEQVKGIQTQIENVNRSIHAL